MAIKKILVPTDFSPHAHAALDAAVGLARPLGSSIHLLHVIQLPFQPMASETVALPVVFWEDLQRDATTRLEKQKREVESAGVECTVESTEDTPSFGVAAGAKRVHADLIVMGSRGLSGLNTCCSAPWRRARSRPPNARCSR